MSNKSTKTTNDNNDTAVSNDALKAKVISFLENGMNLGKIEGYLLFEHDFSTNQAKEYLANIRDELGMSRGGSHADWTETVAYLRKNYGKVEKKALINGMCELNGKTYATNQHSYNYIAMAIEWAKQEIAAQ